MPPTKKGGIKMKDYNNNFLYCLRIEKNAYLHTIYLKRLKIIKIKHMDIPKGNYFNSKANRKKNYKCNV